MAQAPPEGPRDLEHATWSQVKRRIRRILRKRDEPEHYGLNIYPMMDMMTILLVFMVMQFASSTAAVVQTSDELQIPYSTSSVELGEAVAVQVSRSEILVDGERVVRLQSGRVSPSDKRGGESGFLIVPLFEAMDRIREMRKLIAAQDPQRPFEGEVQIIADKRTPYRTISEVIYTAGQTEFANLRFVVNRERTE